MNPLLIVLYVLLGLLAVYAVLFLIAVLRAVFMKKEFADDKPFDPYKDGIDCDAHAEHLSKIIQVPTVSTVSYTHLDVYKRQTVGIVVV